MKFALCLVVLGLSAAWAAEAPSTIPGEAPIIIGSRVSYTFHVGMTMAAPDCFEKPVITVNGRFLQPIEVIVGQTLSVNVFNDMPEDYPQLAEGITIHWHGLDQRGFEWMDGVGYLQLCPIPHGENFTYTFEIHDAPGTYFWHGHSSHHVVDGFMGPFVIHPAGPELISYDGEVFILLQDWWHSSAAPLAMPLSRPFDDALITPDSGNFGWVDNPQSLLINGRGFFMDCTMGASKFFYDPMTDEVQCKVEHLEVDPGRSAVMPWASNFNPGCQHFNMTVEQGKTYRLRLVNGGSFVPMMFCLEGHNMTIVAADATYTEPYTVKCVEMNLAQRYDVLIKADQPVANYWMFVHATHFAGVAAGYGVVNYKGAPIAKMPTTPTPQPSSLDMWTSDDIDAIVTNRALLDYVPPTSAPVATASVNLTGKVTAGTPDWSDYPWPGNQTNLRVPETADRVIILNITQPLMEGSGQLRYGFNDVITHEAPPCSPVMDKVYYEASWVTNNTVPIGASPPTTSGVQEGNSTNANLYLYNVNTPPTHPVTGQQYLPISLGEVIDVVLQNLPANANNGDYRVFSNVTARRQAGLDHNQSEPHPIHMHGHHFWVLGHSDMGIYNPMRDQENFNLVNPIFRDTVTVAAYGWTVLRFISDNPGLWAFHCHIFWHAYMGQAVVLVEEPSLISAPPPNRPTCTKQCYYQFAAWKKSFVKANWGTVGYELPENEVPVAAFSMRTA